MQSQRVGLQVCQLDCKRLPVVVGDGFDVGQVGLVLVRDAESAVDARVPEAAGALRRSGRAVGTNVGDLNRADIHRVDHLLGMVFAKGVQQGQFQGAHRGRG